MRLASWAARRGIGVTTLLLIAGMVVVAAGSAARTPDTVDTDGLVKPLVLPLGLGSGTTTVVLKLAGDPITVAESKAGREFSKKEKNAIEARLKAQQDSIKGQIQQLGGEVVADYQNAYNGIKVTINRSKADDLDKLAGVIAVRPLQLMRPDNTRAVSLIGTPGVWGGLASLHGENVKIAVIDTGIDYTHANFGGPGTTAAFNAANAANTLPPSAAHGWGMRVKGGIDLVGDSYNADPSDPAYQPVPHPDPNPLDCNGHGSHVAGSAAGSGVLASGATYAGAYNASTISGNSWTIGPGVAPKADLYAIRVFGCEGSTDVTVDAIEWAVANDMDVINMSLGSPFGSATDPSAEASTNAAKAGIIVVASAGNSGPNQYITGSPATAEGAISVAANDPIQTSPGATLKLSTGPTISVLNANNASFANGTVYTVAVLRNSYPTGSVARGCSQAEYAAFPGGVAALAGKLIVTVRGTCSRVARAIFAQQNGAAAAAMIDTSTGYPPFEGPITGSAETGPYNVTIPFFGVRGLAASATSDGGLLRLADGGTALANNAPLANANYTGFASFSSGGPRSGDSGLKPDITAPGVSITSTGVGSGNGPLTISGTSMASPMVAGVAALTRQAHPSWDVRDIKAAIVNTGSPAGVAGHRISRGGTGLVQPAGSTGTQVVAAAGKLAVSVNFGFDEFKTDLSKVKSIKLRNNGSSAATFNVAQANPAGSPHSIALSSSSVTVPAGGSAEVQVTLSVPAATVAGIGGSFGLSFREVAGLVQFTPATASDNSGITLRVPYYLVPRSLSTVSTKLGTSKLKTSAPSTTATITNSGGAIAGDADFYAWGLSDPSEARGDGNNEHDGDNNDEEGDHGDAPSPHDVRAVGVQSLDGALVGAPGDQYVAFAVNTYERWSNASTIEFDVNVDVDNDGVVDYIVVGYDQGAIQNGTFNGRMLSWVFSTRSPGGSAFFFAQAPTDNSTVVLPFLASQLCRANEPCLSAANPRFTYDAVTFDLVNGGSDVVDGKAKYNAYTPAITTGGYQTVAPAGTASETIAVNAAEWARTPALGVMVATLDNKSGKDEAQLLPVSFKP